MLKTAADFKEIIMRLNKHFVPHELDGQAVIVPVGDADFHGLVQGNKTLAAIAECLASDTTEEEIVNTLCERFDGDREEIKADVNEAIRRLRQIGAIDE